MNVIGTQLHDPITRDCPIAYDGKTKHDAAAELGRDLVSKDSVQPEYGDEQADARRECRNRLARQSSHARTGTGKYSFSLFR